MTKAEVIQRLIDEVTYMAMIAGYTKAECKQMTVERTDGTFKGIRLSLSPDTLMCPVMYVDGISANDDVHQIAIEFLNAALRVEKEKVPDVKNFSLDNVYLHLLNKEKHKNLVENGPSVPIADLVGVFYYHFSPIAKTHLSYALLNEWGNVTPEDLYNAAMKNADKYGTVTDIKDLNLLPYAGDYDDGASMKVIADKELSIGAGTIFSKKICDQLLDTGKNVYIIPSSRHELIAFVSDKEADKDMLTNMIREVNTMCVSEEDFLSDNLYRLTEKGLIIA